MIHFPGNPERIVLNLQSHRAPVEARMKSWKQTGFLRRLWEKDPSLWPNVPGLEVKDLLGWLDLPESSEKELDAILDFAEGVRKDHVTHVVLLGMGGSSLAPEVFQKVFGNSRGFPELLVLDSTHPEAVREIEARIQFPGILFLVASKSGTTLETLSFFQYFWERIAKKTEQPGRHFAAITDPGTPLEEIAQELNFRKIFLAPPDVGGRFSALTSFGLVPAALIGIDVREFLCQARIEAKAHGRTVGEALSPGIRLGAAVGELSRTRDKMTFLASPPLSSFTDWIEQLVAESLGKDGIGPVPVTDEPRVSEGVYGKDRFFVALVFGDEENKDLEGRILAVEKAGFPIIRIHTENKIALSREIYLWETAVPAAGAALGIQPFDQPDVLLTKKLTQEAMEKGGGISRLEENQSGCASANDQEKLEVALKEWLSQARPGNYICLQAFLPPGEQTKELLQSIRLELLRRTGLATTLGYGPRYLHSTGQLHKGGPNSGLFLQIVDEPGMDLPVPGSGYSFRTLIKAQADGDLRALRERGRRVLRVNLEKKVLAGLENFRTIVQRL